VTVLAAVASALAVALLIPSRPRLGRDVRRRRPWPVLVLLVVAALAAGSPRAALLTAIAAGAVAGGTVLWEGRRRRRVSVEVAGRVLETCELVAGELAAGQAPAAALQRAADAWPPLAPVAEAFRVGSDVPDAFRRVAEDLPGAQDLRLVAAAWQVAHRTGTGLTQAVDRVSEGLRAAAATRRVVQGELASARATARLVAGLPVLALLMGSGAGGDPWGFLLGRPVGLACLAGGLTFAFAGLWWIEAIARDVDRSAGARGWRSGAPRPPRHWSSPDDRRCPRTPRTGGPRVTTAGCSATAGYGPCWRAWVPPPSCRGRRVSSRASWPPAPPGS
jgi:tight adherence protein B